MCTSACALLPITEIDDQPVGTKRARKGTAVAGTKKKRQTKRQPSIKAALKKDLRAKKKGLVARKKAIIREIKQVDRDLKSLRPPQTKSQIYKLGTLPGGEPFYG